MRNIEENIFCFHLGTWMLCAFIKVRMLMKIEFDLFKIVICSKYKNLNKIAKT